MKKYIAIPLLALLGSICALALRFFQNQTGFEAATGLPIAGNRFALALPVLLALLALAFVLLSRKLPRETRDTELPFCDYFSAKGPGIPSLLVTGIFLWMVSGALEIWFTLTFQQAMVEQFLTGDALPPLYHLMSADAASPKIRMLLGLLTVGAAACLLPMVAVCRRGREKRPFNGNLLLAPVVYLVVRLVLTYRGASVDPSLLTYYVELLALALLILSFYRTASFAFQNGRSRRFMVYGAMAVVLCAAAAADVSTLSGLLFYAGGAVLSMSLLLLRLSDLTAPAYPQD